jgi:anti-anti-sigma factor
MMMQLDDHVRDDGVSHVELSGRLDLKGLHEVDMRFHGLTAARGAPAVVDLSGVEYIASLGMGMLVSCAQSLQRKGKTMVLFGASGDVDAALRTAGLDAAIPMVADLDAALELAGR